MDQLVFQMYRGIVETGSPIWRTFRRMRSSNSAALLTRLSHREEEKFGLPRFL